MISYRNFLAFIWCSGMCSICRDRFRAALFFLCFVLLLPVYSYGQSLYDTSIKPADALPEHYLPKVKGKRVALVINQTSVIGNISLLDLLRNSGVNVVRIFVPEHGFRGKEDAGANVESSIDSATQIPVISLYGKHKKPATADLADVDIVVYDLQDVGVRFYTYISTLQYVMEACGQNHRQLMILDRPNPNGFYVDGPVLDTAFRSFVGMQPIPIVYGMTAGEYAKMLAGERWCTDGASLDLVVIKCANYTHAKKYKLPVSPSPNLRTMAAVYAYPSLCLFEGTVVSVGRGTEWPFQQYGSPDLDSTKYTGSFIPRSSEGAKSPPHEGMRCYGEIVGKTDEDVLKRMDNRLCLDWLLRAYTNYSDKNRFFNAFFVKLAGSQDMENNIKNGVPEPVIRTNWQPGLEGFKKIRKKYLLYD